MEIFALKLANSSQIEINMDVYLSDRIDKGCFPIFSSLIFKNFLINFLISVILTGLPAGCNTSPTNLRSL